MRSRRIAYAAAFLFLVALGAVSGCKGFWPFVKGDDRATARGGQAKAPATPSKGVLVKTPPVPARLLAYDFGAEGAWEGFVAVPGAKSVKLSAGVRIDFDRAHGSGFPDPLAGDYVTADKFTVTISGLRDGTYRAGVIAQGVAAAAGAGTMRIGANGKNALAVDVTPEWYTSDKGLFYGVQFDDLPSSPYWDRYVEPAEPWRFFEFDSTGELVLTLENCRLYALVIARENDVSAKEFNAFIEATQAARKAYFLLNKFEFAEEPLSRGSGAEKRFLERGYVVFTRSWGEDVAYDAAPRASEIAASVEAAGAPGERVPITFAVRALRPLQGVAVAVSDLSAPGGKIIPSQAIAVASVRSVMRPAGKGRYALVPDAIQYQADVSIPAGITKRWWLTVDVPPETAAGTYTGQVRFTPNGAPGTVLSLVLQVHPFTLAAPQASFGVGYSDPGETGLSSDEVGGVDSPRQGDDGHRRDAGRNAAVEAFRLATLDADLHSLARHGFNGITLPAPRVVSISADGKVSLDFGDTDAYPPLLRKHGIDVDFPGETLLSDVARQIKRVGLGGVPVAEYSTIYQKAYADAVAQIRDYWKQAGVKMIALAVEEPREKEIGPSSRNMRDTLWYLNLIRDVGGLPSTVMTARDEEEGVSYLPILQAEDVVETRASLADQQSVTYARKAGKPLRFYDGGWNRYAFGFYVWAQKPEGSWQREFCSRDSSFDPFRDDARPGAVYPSPNGPIPTMRYERAAQGIYDYRYALTLEEYITKAKGSYKPAAISAAREGQQLLDDIRKGVSPWLADKKDRAVTVPNATLSAWRSRIATRITAIVEALE